MPGAGEREISLVFLLRKFPTYFCYLRAARWDYLFTFGVLRISVLLTMDDDRLKLVFYQSTSFSVRKDLNAVIASWISK